MAISLIGKFKITCRNETVNGLSTRRLRTLLAYLALHKETEISRQRIAFLFWPDSTEGQARTNLRQLLHHLRRAFPQAEDFLQMDARIIRWRSDAAIQVDVDHFIHLVSAAKEANQSGDEKKELESLQKAAALYAGDLLPECYEEWIEPRREELRVVFADLLRRLIVLLEGQNRYKDALNYARRLLALDEFDETVYRVLMRLYALDGNHSAMVRIYKQCLTMLQEELDARLARETEELFTRLNHPKKPRIKRTEEHETVLIGRNDEMNRLRKICETVVNGAARILLICGEAGIGKTRLAEELTAYADKLGWNTGAAACYAGGGRLAYAPVSALLNSPAIYPALKTLDAVWRKELSRLLPELFPENDAHTAPAPLSESWQRQRFFEALARAALASGRPILLFIDNLQWCDSETVDWLHYLLRYRPSAPLLLAAAVRPEAINANGDLLSFVLELRRGPLLEEIELSAMNFENTVRLTEQLTGHALDKTSAEKIFTSTEGNPLFVVETVRAALERKKKNGADENHILDFEGLLPQKIHAVIQSRLSRLTPQTRKLMELAAVIGREFSYHILAEACEECEETLVQSLDELWRHRLIRELRQREYDFSHDKIREVCAAEISKTRLCKTAEALEKLHHRRLDEMSGQLALHWEQAGFPDKAVPYYEMAGRFARGLFANENAEQHFRAALRLIKDHFPQEEKERRELQILHLLSPCLVQGRGYGASEVHTAAARLWTLSEKLHQLPGSPLLRMLAIGKLVAGEISSAEQFGGRLLKQAAKEKDVIAEVEAHYTLGVTCHWRGDFLRAREHLQKAHDLYEETNHPRHISQYSQNPAVICRIRLSLVLWHLGFPLEAQKTARAALNLAEKLEHPFSKSYALHWSAWLQNLRGDVQSTLKEAETSIEFSGKYRFPYFATQSGVLAGWAAAQLGNRKGGIQQMRESISRFRTTGAEVGCSYYRALIAAELAKDGARAQSHALLQEALRSVRSGEEGWPEAAILRIKGAVLWQSGEKKRTEAENF